MNQMPGDFEDRLRGLMNIAAGEPRRHVAVDAVRRGVARRRKIASAAASAALVLACGAGVAVAQGTNGGGHGRPGPHAGGHSRTVKAPRGTGIPRFYVVQTVIPNNGKTVNRTRTSVLATATSAVRARIQCPLSGRYVVAWPIAPAQNQNFFLVCQRASGPQYSKILDSRIFEFHVTTSGRVTGYRAVRGGELGSRLVQSIAATPDGSELAVVVYPGNHPPDLHRTPPDVIVIDTRTGTQSVWHGADPISGNTVYWPREISLTADGQSLVFLTQPQCFQTGCSIRAGQQMRVIAHPANGGGQLNSARLLLRLNSVLRLSSATVMAAVVAPDGLALTLAVTGRLSGPRNPNAPISIVQISLNRQRRLSYLYRLPQGDAFSFFSADPSGGHFLLGTGTPYRLLDGRIYKGRLIPLGPDPTYVLAMVW